MIVPPENIKIIEWKTSTMWFDEHGILCSVSKKASPQSIEEVEKDLIDFKRIIGDRKVCLLVDVTNTSESTKEVRDYVALEFPKIVKAIAMVSDSVLGRMLANLFFRIKSQPYPVKMFTHEYEAKEWLKKFL